MKLKLKTFQTKAVKSLRKMTAMALGNYNVDHFVQVVSYTAPTGAGKTIIMSSLIETIYFGGDEYEEQPDAIFVWLSDSPELNQQSKDKIMFYADKILPNQTITIEDASFDAEVLDDGNIYFLNTQKLSKSSNLTQHGDNRQYTIWETLNNTIRTKPNRLYLIIDEAHRGAKNTREVLTTMQKFVLSSDKDGLPVFPVTIGMSATVERFNALIKDSQSGLLPVRTDVEEVKQSGLLKDKIILHYPDSIGNDMAVLEAAVDDWKEKCLHWKTYCVEQHYKMINPALIIQVKSGSKDVVSDTELAECMEHINKKLPTPLLEGEVVHTFGGGTDVEINGFNIQFTEPSMIADNEKIKVVFFKENLSTGWDCPRAETMMSFRTAKDKTYIAQLLGRMVRTPLGMHVERDEILNEVRLFLPYFDEKTAEEVKDELRGSAEGGLFTDMVETQQIGEKQGHTITTKPKAKRSTTFTTGKILSGQPTLSFFSDTNLSTESITTTIDEVKAEEHVQPSEKPTPIEQINDAQVDSPEVQESIEKLTSDATDLNNNIEDEVEEVLPAPYNREEVINFVDGLGLRTCRIRNFRIKNYLQSMFDLARLASQSKVDTNAYSTVMGMVVKMIHDHIEKVKANGEYEQLKQSVLEFKLKTQIFDVYGHDMKEATSSDYISSTEADLDRQVRVADCKLGSEGVYKQYAVKYYDIFSLNEPKIDIVIFTADNQCLETLHKKCEEVYGDMVDDVRMKMINQPNNVKDRYQRIVIDADEVSWLNFELPLSFRDDGKGKKYERHLFVQDYSGVAQFNLNSWEDAVIEEEEAKDDYVCWLRNYAKKGSWGLAIPYKMDGKMHEMHPDFLIIRHNDDGYILDILEPHDQTRTDNLPKAKGLAKYAMENSYIGRIELIHVKANITGKHYLRVDLTKTNVRKAVQNAKTDVDLNDIFNQYGYNM